ncbi:hypothetical protein MTR_8g042640 [Medicago truncatula]|uniref:Uncharacterized protein n=1 Tax=Medicago truncatula TaxID=3880 RepID=A0A072TNW1_MEDTR|nr:hypothetical protein MTR_8g042640 [Medicago truncatula]
MRNILKAEFTENEVLLAAKDLKSHAAPGYGMSALFYQQFWGIVGKDVTSFALKILNGGGNSSNINYTYICLIPKMKKSKVPVLVRSFILNEASVKGTFYLLTYSSNVLKFLWLLNKAEAEKGLHGIQIARGAPKINHLFFADDSRIFCRYSFQDFQTIQEIFNT